MPININKNKHFLIKVIVINFTIVLSVNMPSKAQDCETGKLIVDQNFDQYTDTSIYTINMANADFAGIRAYTSGEIRGLGTSWPHKTRVMNGVLRAEYIANTASGRNGGFLFDKEFEPVEKAMLEYRVKFDKNFTWAAGGKLPGLGGSSLSGNGTIPSGCVSRTSNNSKNGFSCRLMWRTNRGHTAAPKLVVYVYHPNRPQDCGEDFFIVKDIKKDRWYTIRQYIELNTPGQNNGILKIYIDDKLLVNKSDMQYRLAGKEQVKLNSLIMNTYRGGAATDPVWWSPNTDYTYFDDIKVWTNCDDVNTGLSSIEATNLIVFPNPSQTGVFKLNESEKWYVANIHGRIIQSGNGKVIDLSNQPSGMYLLMVDNRTRKLVITSN